MALAVVQAGANGGTGAGQTTIVVTMPSNFTADNGAVLWLGWENQAATISSIVGGGTWTSAFSKFNDTEGDNRSIQGFINLDLTATDTVTITFSASVTYCSAHILEVSGHDATQPDAVSTGRTQYPIGSTTDAIASNSCTTATDGALVVGYCNTDFGGVFTSLNAGTGMTQGPDNPADVAMSRIAYVTKATAGAQVITFTADGATSSAFTTGAIAVKPSAGGGIPASAGRSLTTQTFMSMRR